jgi:hypothetical protein
MEVDGVMRNEPRGSLGSMPTLVKDPPPAGFEELLERRRRLGQDLFDEVWDGVLHVNPAPHSRHGKVGAQLAALLYEPGPRARAGPERSDEPRRAGGLPGSRSSAAADARRRVSPDRGARGRDRLPGDDTWRKLDFYAAHHVDGLLIVDPEKRHVDWLGPTAAGDYAPLERSNLIDGGPAELSGRLNWPE